MTHNQPEKKESKRERSLKILSNVHNLPTIPVVVFEVTKLIEDQNANAASLSKIIGKDQGLVTKILSVANSPLYGIPRRVSTIDFAIVILGFNHIKNIVIALSMMETFKKLGDNKFPHREYWIHSFMTATLSKRISDDLGYLVSGESFTSGLLHDMGVPIIYKYFNKEYQQILQVINDFSDPTEYAEQESIGMTHEEIGKFLLDRWNLPLDLGDVILYHQHPALAEKNKALAAIVHIADYMTEHFMNRSFVWDKNNTLDISVIEILKLGDENYLENFIQSYKELFINQLEAINFIN